MLGSNQIAQIPNKFNARQGSIWITQLPNIFNARRR